MNHDPLTVCVTGAAGQIAYSFIPQLLKGNVFGDRPINLRLLDITPALNVLKGVILEINDCTYKLLNSVTFFLFRFNSVIMLKKCSRTVMSLFSWADSPESQAWKEKICFKKIKTSLLFNQRPCMPQNLMSSVLSSPILPIPMLTFWDISPIKSKKKISPA
jgi:hypothetical protein